MNAFSRIIAVALLGAGTGLSMAADEVPGKVSASGAGYNVVRSFTQPVREDPVGRNITTNRAFWGAPPPTPHAFVTERGENCLACHARENRIEKGFQAIAPVPHAEYTSCQQCHVSGTPSGTGVFRENLFVGLDYPGKGTRAHPYAPPTIPHKVFMRDNCLSCHGPVGKQRIASPHPYRSQCQQCHVPDASKNYDRPVPWGELKGKL